MQCARHEDREASGRCVHCTTPVCAECRDKRTAGIICYACAETLRVKRTRRRLVGVASFVVVVAAALGGIYALASTGVAESNRCDPERALKLIDMLASENKEAAVQRANDFLASCGDHPEIRARTGL